VHLAECIERSTSQPFDVSSVRDVRPYPKHSSARGFQFSFCLVEISLIDVGQNYFHSSDLLPKIRTQLSMISDFAKAEKPGRSMSRSKHTEAQIIGALKQVEAGRTAEDVARECGVSKHTIYAWKAKYGGLEVSEAQRLRQLEDENGRLKKLVADLSLDKEMLKAVIAKNGLSS